MLFSFKKRQEDFKISEILPFIPSGNGDLLYEQKKKSEHDGCSHLPIQRTWIEKKRFRNQGSQR